VPRAEVRGLLWSAGLFGYGAGVALADPWNTPRGQLLLGLVWGAAVLLWLRYEDNRVRAQAVGVVLCTAVVEVVATQVCGWWDYRWGNIPAFLPPGHAGVLVTTLVLCRALGRVVPARPFGRLVLTGGGLWAAWGLFLSDRPDTVGAFWFVVLLVLYRHPVIGPRVPYLFLITLGVELIGIACGVWAYRPHDVTGLLALGNPPAGIAGTYAFIQYLALRLTPTLLAAWAALRDRPAGLPVPRRVPRDSPR
jgi:hypothetical protein